VNEIVLTDLDGVFVEQIDLLTANVPFFHVDRIAKTNVLIYVLSGCIYVTEEGTDYAINPGEMIFLKKGTHQYGHRLIKAETSWIYVHFQINQMGNSEAFSDTSIQKIVLPKNIKELDKTEFPKELKNILRISSTSKKMKNSRVSTAFHRFLLNVYDQNDTAAKDGITDRILNFLQEHIHEDLSAGDLEDHLHLTYKYLVRVFKKDIGMGIMKYHNMQRIYAAASELRSTSKSISEVSGEFGFGDPLYFSKCFKKQMAMSPREYRKIQSIF